MPDTLLDDPEPTPLVFPPGSYAARVVADGASNYWRLGETSGTTAVDVIGGKNGTLSGGVTLGQPGGVPGDTAMLFNGSTGKVQTAAAVPVPLTCSVEAWIRASAPNSQQPVLSTRLTGNTGTTVYAGTAINGPFNHAMWFSAGFVVGTRNLNDGRWHHLVWVAAGGTVQIYVDGTLDGTGADARATPSAGPAAIGWDQTANEWWSGSLDEVAVYPRALTAPEVAAHYAVGTTLGPGDTTTLWRKWQDANQAFNNEEHAALLNGFPPQDLTTQLSRFLWGSYASSQNPTAAHDRYVNLVLADGASHFWKLSDTGTTAVDIAGGVSGTLSGGVTTGVAGAFTGDTAMTFDGVDDKVVTAANVTIPLTCTVECWLKITSAVHGLPLITVRATDAGDYFSVSGATNGGLWIFAANTSVNPGTISVTDGQWHHAVWVLNGTTVQYFVDGMPDPVVVGNTVRFAANTQLCRFCWDVVGNSFTPGSLDNVAIYPRALSAAEVARHYAARG